MQLNIPSIQLIANRAIVFNHSIIESLPVKRGNPGPEFLAPPARTFRYVVRCARLDYGDDDPR